MSMRCKKWENITSIIGRRTCIGLGIVIFIASLILIVLSDDVLLSLATKFALVIGDAQRIEEAGIERLVTELIHVIKKLKLLLLIFSTSLIVWGLLWSHFSRRITDYDIASKKPPLAYSSIPLLVLFLLLLIAASLRLINFTQSLLFDEIYSVLNYIDRGSFLKAITTYKYFNNHIFYSICARISMLTFGKIEWAYRVPSLIFGLAGIWAVTRLSSLTNNKRIILISTIFLVFSPLHIDQSTQARGYTALVFFSMLSCYFFLRTLKEQKVKLWWGFATVTIVGLYAHLYMAMVLLSQLIIILLGVFLLKERGKPLISYDVAYRFVLYTTIAVVVTFILYAPVLPYIFFELFRHRVTKIIDIGFIVSVFNNLGSGMKGLDCGYVYFFLFILGLVFMWKKQRIIIFL